MVFPPRSGEFELRYSRKVGPPIVSAAVATLVLTNFATVSILKDDAANRFELFSSIWPIALTSAVAVILVMSFLYKSLVDLVEELETREASPSTRRCTTS